MLSERLERKLALTQEHDDQYLFSPEYKFLYERNKGIYRNYMDQEDDAFFIVWTILSTSMFAIETSIRKNVPMIEQKYSYDNSEYSCLWVNPFKMKEVGPPDVIEWSTSMPKPKQKQIELF